MVAKKEWICSQSSDSPVVSVITVVYNGKDYLERTIKSVLDQSCSNSEYLIIDGNSQDGTIDLILAYEDQIHYWVSESDDGIYDAMDKGIKWANGKWIIFMNAGDTFFDKTTLEKCVEALIQNDDKIIVYGDAQITYGEQKTMQIQDGRHRDFNKSIIHQSMFIKTCYLKSNPYDLAYRIMADYDWLLSVSVSNSGGILYFPVVVCTYDKTGVSSRPLYTYFFEYYKIAYRRMPFKNFISFNFYIFPRLLWSFISPLVKKFKLKANGAAV